MSGRSGKVDVEVEISRSLWYDPQERRKWKKNKKTDNVKKIKMESNATQTKLPTLSTSATSLETGNRVVQEEVTKSKQPYISTLSPTHSKQQKQTSGSPANRKQLTEYGQKKRSPECPRGKQQKKGYEGGRGPPRMRKVSTEEKLEREQRRIERQQRQFEKQQLKNKELTGSLWLTLSVSKHFNIKLEQYIK